MFAAPPAPTGRRFVPGVEFSVFVSIVAMSGQQAGQEAPGQDVQVLAAPDGRQQPIARKPEL
ncbi:MAG TPA: hypothetical protein VF125_07285 [Solirubrobacterales bacterium]